VRVFPFDETDAFAQAHPHLQVMAGHEAASTMAGFDLSQTRGFVLAIQGTKWHVINQSHPNQTDAESNPMRMESLLFQEVVAALQNAGILNPILH
jgi:hypothetical protein